MYLTPSKSLSDYKKVWYRRNRDKRLAQELDRRADIDWLLRTMYNRAKRNARIKGLEFNIERTDLVVPEYCPIFPWIKLTAISGEGFVDSNISLDRKNSAKGYVKGNVQVISYKANRNKNNSTIEELIALGDWARYVSDTDE